VSCFASLSTLTRPSWSRIALAAALVCMLRGSAWAAGAPAPQRLASVNVSYIFENYKKVTDLQRTIDEKFKLDDGKLQLKFKELTQRNKELDPYLNKGDLDSVDPVIFEKVQMLRRDQFQFSRERQQYDENVQKAYTKGMKDILTDIRVAIRTIADVGRFDLVLRSADAEDPQSEGPLLDPSKQTYLAALEPKTVAEMTERFNRNPVLFGAKPTDITNDVLKRLNDEYARRSSGNQK
jgi:Skp family chaperone for outer membrane proteins